MTNPQADLRVAIAAESHAKDIWTTARNAVIEAQRVEREAFAVLARAAAHRNQAFARARLTAKAPAFPATQGISP